MNKNCYGIIKLNDNENLNLHQPAGFIVREKIINGKPVSLEYGTYIDDHIFLSVPIHYTIKDKLTKLNFNQKPI